MKGEEEVSIALSRTPTPSSSHRKITCISPKIYLPPVLSALVLMRHLEVCLIFFVLLSNLIPCLILS